MAEKVAMVGMEARLPMMVLEEEDTEVPQMEAVMDTEAALHLLLRRRHRRLVMELVQAIRLIRMLGLRGVPIKRFTCR